MFFVDLLCRKSKVLSFAFFAAVHFKNTYWFISKKAFGLPKVLRYYLTGGWNLDDAQKKFRHVITAAIRGLLRFLSGCFIYLKCLSCRKYAGDQAANLVGGKPLCCIAFGSFKSYTYL